MSNEIKFDDVVALLAPVVLAICVGGLGYLNNDGSILWTIIGALMGFFGGCLGVILVLWSNLPEEDKSRPRVRSGCRYKYPWEK